MNKMKRKIMIFGVLLWCSLNAISKTSISDESDSNKKMKFTGVISDAVNGMSIDSVMVSAGGIKTYSDHSGAFTVEVPAYRSRESKDYTLTFSKDNFNTLELTVSEKAASNIVVKMKSPYPMSNIFHLFSDPAIPDQGAKESPTTKKCAWSDTVPDLIGGQLNRHNFIYIGENHRRICLVIDGKLAWHYDTEDSWEDDDVWLLSNGNVLHAHMKYIEEISPKKEIVWRYDNPQGTEIHTCQPIGIDKVLFLQNQGEASVVKLYNKVTGKFEIDKELKELSGGVHGQCRRLRMTSNGTYVAGTLSTHTFYEYDKDFNLIWTMDPGPMWGGIPLRNGNYLIQNEKELKAIELNRNGDVIWQVSIADILPQLISLVPGMGKITGTQTCERLSNGNTVVFTRYCDAKIPQAIEITPDKRVVWILKDWKHLGDGLSAQFLDEPGYPEVPGEINH
jgi:hypothetical protein